MASALPVDEARLDVSDELPEDSVIPMRPPAARQLLFGGIVVGALLIGATVAVADLVPEPPPPPPLDLAVVPPTIDRRWSVESNVPIERVLIGDAVVVVVDSLNLIAAYGRVDGRRLWARQTETIATQVDVELADDVVVLIVTLPDALSFVVPIDGLTGQSLWATRPLDAVYTVSEDRLIRTTDGDAGREVLVHDVRTGAPLGDAVQVGSVTAPYPHIASDVAGQVSVVDSETASVVAGPVDRADLRMVTALDGRMIGFTENGEIVAYDDNGQALDQSGFVSNVLGDVGLHPNLVGSVPGHDISIASDNSSVGFTVTDGRVKILWERSGTVGESVLTEIGPLSVVQVLDTTTDEVDFKIANSVTGETIFETDVRRSRDRRPVLYADGFVVARRARRLSRVVTAFDYGGNQLWERTVEFPATFVIGNGLFAVTESVGDGARVTLFG
jgi:hypothetical protein